MISSVDVRFINTDDPDFDFTDRKLLLLDEDILFEFNEDEWIFRIIDAKNTNKEGYVIDLSEDPSLDICFMNYKPKVKTEIDFEILVTASFLDVVRFLAKQQDS